MAASDLLSNFFPPNLSNEQCGVTFQVQCVSVQTPQVQASSGVDFVLRGWSLDHWSDRIGQQTSLSAAKDN